MRVNLLPLLNGTQRTIEVQFEIKIPDDFFQELYVSFDEPVKVLGRIENLEDCILLKLHLSANITTCCARCAKELKLPLDIKYENVIVKDPEEQNNTDMIVLTGYQLDLFDVVITAITLNLQTKYLCDENCRGLCPKCGADLNMINCGCQTEDTDDRLKILKRLL